MRWEFIPDCKFNLRCKFGCSWDDEITQDMGLALATMVSECLDSINDPILGKIEEQLGIEGSDKLSLADYGSLVFADFSKNKGTKVYLGLPPWCKKYSSTIEEMMTLLLAGSYWNYINDFEPDVKWIFPLNFYPTEQMQTYEFVSNKQVGLKFDANWILPSGVQKLSRILYELSSRTDVVVRDSTLQAVKLLLKKARMAQEIPSLEDNYSSSTAVSF